MRVEYADYGLGSTYNLVITAKEFLKAEDSDAEMEILDSVVTGYAGDGHFGAGVYDDDYEAVKRALLVLNATKVVFALTPHLLDSNGYVRNTCEIYVLKNNHAEIVRFFDVDKEHKLLRQFKHKESTNETVS